LLRDRYSDKLNDVFVSKVAKESEFLDIHVRKMSSDVANGDSTTTVGALVHVLGKEGNRTVNLAFFSGESSFCSP
jgi:hypothetical protein